MSYNEVVNSLIECKEILAIALGGSRSRGEENPNSDYDLFCVISDNFFRTFRNSFRIFLENIPCILYAAEAFYLEYWGYLFKAIDINNICYDISIIPKSRMEEMSIRSTNVIIKDTDGIYQYYINHANDDEFLISKLECQHVYDYCTLFGFERKRFSDAVRKSDYWYIVRCLERMKNYLIRCDRIQREIFPKSRSCPEKEYSDINDCLKKIYIIDGNLETLIQTAENLCNLFDIVIRDKEMRMRSRL